MRPRDKERADKISSHLLSYSKENTRLPGIEDQASFDCLIEQIIESIRRIEYVHLIVSMKHDERRKRALSPFFDPLKAAILHHRTGNYDEAFWLIFLATHFGKHARDGWSLCASVYSKLGTIEAWDWECVSNDPFSVRHWIENHVEELRALPYAFSNHRQYVSLTAGGNKGTAAAMETYISWILDNGGHVELVRKMHKVVGQEPTAGFDYLYKEMDVVRQFGRLGRFDYLTMIGKLGFAPIKPGVPYMDGATGPIRGARLLCGGDVNSPIPAKELDIALQDLGQCLGLGMQVVEDSLCNWQKSPREFISFRG